MPQVKRVNFLLNHRLEYFHQKEPCVGELSGMILMEALLSTGGEDARRTQGLSKCVPTLYTMCILVFAPHGSKG